LRYLRGEITEAEADTQLVKDFYDPTNILQRIIDGKARELGFTRIVHETSRQLGQVVLSLQREFDKMHPSDKQGMSDEELRTFALRRAPKLVERYGPVSAHLWASNSRCVSSRRKSKNAIIRCRRFYARASICRLPIYGAVDLPLSFSSTED
jgi:hypothetical protein